MRPSLTYQASRFTSTIARRYSASSSGQNVSAVSFSGSNPPISLKRKLSERSTSVVKRSALSSK